MNIIKTSLASLLTLLSVGTAQAQSATDPYFSYDEGSNKLYTYGTEKKENYDVAIRIPGTLAGKTITAISVPFSEDITGLDDSVTVWLASQLKVTNKTIANPLSTAKGQIVPGDFTLVKLSEPYTIPAEGLYAGYTIKATALASGSKAPVLVNADGNPGGFYYHTSRTILKFQDNSSSYNSPLRVYLSGLTTDAAIPTLSSVLYGQAGKPVSLDLTVNNVGSNAISSIGYAYTINGQQGTGNLSVDIPARIGSTTTATIELPAQAKGTYTAEVTITSVNGVANTATNSATATGTVNVYTFLPKHRAVMEEYTGTWCGWCPRGFVGMAVMNRLYPDDFIAISYHNGDPMDICSILKEDSTVAGYDYPSTAASFPLAIIDRTYEGLDPYNGYKADGFGIEKTWKTACDIFAPVDVTVNGTLNDHNTKLTVNATVTPAYDIADANYKVEFVVLEDDLHESDSFPATGSWTQENYYGNYTVEQIKSSIPEPEMEPFYNGTEVSGLHFDDVIVATSRMRGTDANLPATLKEGEGVSVSTTFSTADIRNYVGKWLIQAYNKLRVVALIIDKTTGKIVNANKGTVTGNNIDGISTPQAAANATPQAIYDLQGRQLQQLQHGLNIVKMSDGRTTKVLCK